MATATLDQVGFETAGGAFDTSSALVLPAAGGRGAGLRFTGLPTQHAGESYEQTDRLYDGFTFAPGDASGAPTGTLRIDLVDETNPAAFSASRLPSGLDRKRVATVALSASGAIGTVALDVGPITQRYRRPGWTGGIAFVLTWASSGSDLTIPRSAAEAATLTADDRVLESGLVGARWWGSRIVRDAKTGESIREDAAIRDPLTRGLVAPENADPPEVRTRRPSRRHEPRHR